MSDMRIAAAHVSVQLSHPPSHPFDGRWNLQAGDPEQDREQEQEAKKLSSVDENQTNEATSDCFLLGESAESRGGGEPRRIVAA